MTGKILVVGSINMDLVVRSPHLPRPGETTLGSGFGTYPGGKGANQAVAAARLGAPVAMIGRVGPDAFGNAMQASLSADGVDISGVACDPEAPTGVALITVDDHAENTIVVASGANMRLSPEDVEANEALFEGASLLVMQLEIPLDTIQRAVGLARRHGLRVILNPAPAKSLAVELLEGVDVLIPNEGELLYLMGEKSLGAAMDKARQRGIRALVVTLGEQGALLVDEAGETRVPAYAVTAVDTTAAGDAFVGALAVALAEGKPAGEAARWANAAAAISVTRVGAQPSLPTRAEVEAFLSERMAH
ncbi:MAG TPA: ribokinase [Anaerolineaceae bacterium]|nr:ribokinase [Anaerolineaceae bacterium]